MYGLMRRTCVKRGRWRLIGGGGCCCRIPRCISAEDNPGRVKESYLVEAALPSEAETIVLKEVAPFIFGDCQVQKIHERQFFDVFQNEANKEFWYEAKVEMIVVDGKHGCRKAVNMLVQGNDIHDALKHLNSKLNSYDCEIIAIKKSLILDILKPESAE